MSCNLMMLNNPIENIVTIGNKILLGSVTRRYGKAITLDDNAIKLNECGYYKLDFLVILSRQTAGAVTVAVLQNGVPIPGAIATTDITTAGTEEHSVTIPVIIRKTFDGNAGNNTPDDITVVISGDDSIVKSATTTIFKL